ncbi:MAG: 5'/3'-nucleotidase SurE [Acholeplasmataceae bacterium]
MNILVVNDDGYQALGLKILVRALYPYGNVYVAAPKVQQSAKSQSITYKDRIETMIGEPLHGANEVLVVDGTPADTVRMAFKHYNVDFDLVVAGINHGPNIAKDILYSGTVAAAYEARILGVPAIAVSAHDINADYIYDETVKILDEAIEAKLYDFSGVLNINFPKRTFIKPQGVRLTIQGLQYQHAEFVKSEKQHVYHVKSSIINYQEHEDSDVAAFNEGYISVTPLTLERTDFKQFKKYRQE